MDLPSTRALNRLVQQGGKGAPKVGATAGRRHCLCCFLAGPWRRHAGAGFRAGAAVPALLLMMMLLLPSVGLAMPDEEMLAVAQVTNVCLTPACI